MAIKTNISWTDATWNIAVGCRKVDKDCKFCYMYRESLTGTRYNPRQIRKTKQAFNLPLKIKEPSKIFACSLTDFFHPEIDAYRGEAWDIIRRCPQHTFQILTKRPERILTHLPDDWGDGWDNVWMGTSIGSMEGLTSRLRPLLEVPAKIRFVSFEPLWERINMQTYIDNVLHYNWDTFKDVGTSKIHWAIIGGESGNNNGAYRYRPCQVEWMEEIKLAVEATGGRVFVKQLGTYLSNKLKMSDRHGTNFNDFPESLKVRDFPI